MRIACDHDRSIAIRIERSALLCIDFQNDFVRPDGMAASRGQRTEELAAVLPAARSVLQACRRARLAVVHTRESYLPSLADLNATRRVYDTIVGVEGPLGRFLVRGEHGTEITEEMAPLPDEAVIDKPGFNAFFQTALDTTMRARGVDTLFLMGFTTQCCVASTMRGAVDIGYRCVLLDDCCAAFDPADHEATVRVMHSENDNFGWVSDARRVVEALAGHDAHG